MSSAEGHLLTLFSDYLTKGEEPARESCCSDPIRFCLSIFFGQKVFDGGSLPVESGRNNLNTVGLIQGLGHSSERREPIDFGEYMAEHLKVFEEVSESARL